MPGGNRTGPMGMGPKTGRGAGYCSGYDAPGYVNAGPGRGAGFGYGRGRGRGMAFRRGGNRGAGWGRVWSWRRRTLSSPPLTTDEQSIPRSTVKALEARMQLLQSELSDLKGHLEELTAAEPEEREPR
jgi:hypothetical protein